MKMQYLTVFVVLILLGGCASHQLSTDENAIAEKSVKIGMAPSQVISIKGTHYKKVNHALEGHYTMVYPDIAVRIRGGHVYGIEQSSSGWLQQLKDVPYGGEYP
ncbi:hypothetical protein DDZ13_05435 [Coraliomargarita sinensis]|uniref:Uncharacterized protein n=2 Tax=Coraliomargarita sinensis TaxID=2174842 RepID=A0A317ZGC8_9BACT|nr:hypothetical protein DDZ13_05435 [Coraliomargarita sinensis]